MTWRVGTKVGRNIYLNDVMVAVVVGEESLASAWAKSIVETMNADQTAFAGEQDERRPAACTCGHAILGHANGKGCMGQVKCPCVWNGAV